MKLSELQIGTKLQLEVDEFLDEDINNFLVSAFEWAENETSAYIAAPIHEGVVYPLQKGTSVKIYFISKGDLYTFKAEVLDRSSKDNLALLKISQASELHRIQRRQFFRLECCVPVRYGIVSTMKPEERMGLKLKKAMTRDISGGGLCIAVEEKLEIQSLLYCEILISHENTVSFYGEVIRVDKLDINTINKYEIGLCFSKIDDRQREIIISFIFQEQRKLRQKGLI